MTTAIGKQGKQDIVSDENFEILRKRAIDIWENDPDAKDRILSEGIVDRHVFYRLRKGTKFPPQARLRLFIAIHNLAKMDLYDALSAKIEKSSNDGPDTLRKLYENYVYFRFYADKNRGLIFSEGIIRTFDDNGSANFEHRSHNWPKKNKHPEHTGYLFRSHGYLYMLGFGTGLIRLAIGNMPLKKEKDVTISGMVLSKRSSHPLDPFSARFVMVPDDNADLLKELRDTTRPDMQTPEHWKSNRSKRISKFIEMVGDDSNFYFIYGTAPESEADV